MLMVQSLIDYSISCMEVSIPHNLINYFRLIKCINYNVLTTTFTHFGVFQPYEAIKNRLVIVDESLIVVYSFCCD